jgi:type I restriction enzyme S subunit
MNQAKMNGIPIALPPAAEQHRIVAKVDELMALCDHLEAAQEQCETRRDRVVAASLHRLREPAEAPTFHEDVRFCLNHLPLHTTRVEDIGALRQSIFSLAVRGRLVAQVPDEERPRSAPTTPSDQAPFEIPTNWVWSPLAALGHMKGGGTPSKGREEFWNGTIPWVSPKDMKRDYIDSAQMSITPVAVADSAATMIPAGSILFVVRGMILAHSFPAAIATVPLTINQDMKAITLTNPAYREYLLRALKGLKPLMLSRVQRSSHGTCRIEGRDYSGFPIPLPPLAEQQRIVAKVDELMAVCDRLEAQIVAGESIRSRLLDALLHEVLAEPKSSDLMEVR